MGIGVQGVVHLKHLQGENVLYAVGSIKVRYKKVEIL